jgi:pyridoxine 5-phosphate synthase
MTKLSVNINKIATIRNARGGNNPNLLQMAKDIQSYGAQGITIHPRPDQRHITYKDAIDLSEIISTEFNIEGNPIKNFIDLVCKIKPDQVTLVPDSVDAITSNSGWDTLKNKSFLEEVISEFKNNGIRTSVFVDTDLKLIEGAKTTGADRIELYTESFAVNFQKGNKDEINKYINASVLANDLGMGVNAGHDLSLENIHFFVDKIPYLDEVSIGHAIICESLYLGIENVVNMYLQKINNAFKK